MTELLCEPEKIDMVKIKIANCQEMCDRICSYDKVTRNHVLSYMDCLSDNNRYIYNDAAPCFFNHGDRL